LSEDGVVTRLVQKLRRGTVVKNHDIESIQDTVLSYLQLFKKGNINFSKPLTLKEFDRKTQTGHLAGTFSGLLNRN
jgi:hypothetical protein